MEQNKKIFLCDDSIDGIFTSVYDGWKWGAAGNKFEIAVSEPEGPELFCTFVRIKTDTEKAAKVTGTVKKKLGNRLYEILCCVAASSHEGKGTLIFHILLNALNHGKNDSRVMDDFKDPYVALASKLYIKVWHEVHRFYGFIRFSQLGNQILYSKIAPENDILMLLAPHFENRFSNENWIIYDEVRNKALLHEKRKKCVIRVGVKEKFEKEYILSEKEEYEQLWKTFCKNISIKERENHPLQQQMLPFKYRSNMVEFGQN